MLKKGLSVVLVLVMVLSALPLTGIVSFAETSGDWEYSVLDDGTAEITGFTGGTDELVVPATLDGKTVTRIGESAFQRCTSLASITIPDSVKDIGDYAFYDCESLTSITIPDSVTSVGSQAFRFSAYYKNSGNWENNVLYIGNHLIEAKNTLSGEYSIKENTKTIAEFAFYKCTSLTNITIPDGVTSIGASAFKHCSSLTSLTIPASVTNIGVDAVTGCTALSELIVNYNPACSYSGVDVTTAVVPYGVTSISNSAFYFCSSLTSVTIPGSVTNIGNRAFFDCTSLTSITLPDGITCIDDRAFSGCTALTSITIPDSVTSIGDRAFDGCTALTSITIPDSVTSIGAGVFDGCTSLQGLYGYTGSYAEMYANNNGIVFIPLNGSEHQSNDFNYTILYDGTVEITGYNGNATELVIPSTIDGRAVTSIGDCAFEYCDSLTSVTIPNSVTSIGVSAFYGCTSLTGITVPDSVTSICDEAFRHCSSLTSLTIPGSVTSIGDGAFSRCTALSDCTVNYNPACNYNALKNYMTTVIVPYGVTSIGYADFSLCPALCNFIVDYNPACNYNAIKSYITTVVVPDGVISIGYEAFSGCTSLTSITIPDSVTSIGNGTFSGCTSLAGVTIPDSVISIGDAAFSGCTSLAGVTIPDSVLSIGDAAFSGCTSLTSMTILAGVIMIGNDAFDACTSLQCIYGYRHTPSFVETYANNHGITFISLNGGGSQTNCFCYCHLADNTIQITEYTGAGTKITIPSEIDGMRVSSIAEQAFYDCTSLTSVTIPAGVTSIEDFAFDGCTSLQVIYGYSGSAAEWYAFDEGIAFVALNGSGSQINDFDYTILNNGTIEITGYNGNATELVIPAAIDGKAVTRIGADVFYGRPSLTGVTIPDSVTSIGNYAFENCPSLASITIPAGVTDIGVAAFAGCPALTSIRIPDSVTSIGNGAFYGCPALAHYYCFKGSAADTYAQNHGLADARHYFGDWNGDRDIDGQDFSAIVNASLDPSNMSEVERTVADVNMDGVNDALDCRLVKLLSQGKVLPA